MDEKLREDLKAIIKAERLSRLKKNPKQKKIEKLENDVKKYIEFNKNSNKK